MRWKVPLRGYGERTFVPRQFAVRRMSCPAGLPILLLGRHNLLITREIRILIRYTSQTRTDRSYDL